MKNYLLFTLLLLTVSCKKKETNNEPNTANGNYFSIMQFAQDQFHLLWGQPYTFQKIVTLNGKSDSTFEKATDVDWATVLKPFFESDISDKKYLDQYNFTMFEDNTTETRNFFYEAKNKKLLTQKLQVTADLYNNKISAIYIETEKNGKVQKLYYAPKKLIQIQEFETAFLGKDKNLKVEYYFM